MTGEDIKASIEEYFETIEGDIPSDERLASLCLALDRLAVAVHFAGNVFDDRPFRDARVREYSVVRDIVSPNFPELGYYNVVLDIADKIAETGLAVGDGIDDVCDIARDLEEVLWRWQNTSIDDALWYFKESYGWHWGKHLRDLQLYLHDLQT